jgi:hypothetical protein
MANGKYPFKRYQIIHDCLASKTRAHWTIEELMKKLREEDLKVSKRSVHSDLNKQPLRLTYKKFNAAPDIHTFHPYFLKEYKNRWYVRGYSETIHFYPTLGLDRIEKIEPASVTFKENKKPNPDAYFNHTIGITLGKGAPQEVRLHFTPMQVNYIKTQYLPHAENYAR